MTLEEFEQLWTWNELSSLCWDIDYDLRDDGIYDEGEKDEYLIDEVTDMIKYASNWDDICNIRDYLNATPEGYNYYAIGWDGCDPIVGVDDDDERFIERVKDSIRYYCERWDLFEDAEQEETDDIDLAFDDEELENDQKAEEESFGSEDALSNFISYFM